MKSFLLLAALLIFVPFSNAVATTGGQLMKSCTQDLQKGGDAFDVGFCDGWVDGWINEFHKDAFYWDNDKKELWALDLDKNITVGQMIRVYLKYMAAHPEDENKNAVLCMTRAALDAKLVLMQRVDTTPPAEVH